MGFDCPQIVRNVWGGWLRCRQIEGVYSQCISRRHCVTEGCSGGRLGNRACRGEDNSNI